MPHKPRYSYACTCPFIHGRAHDVAFRTSDQVYKKEKICHESKRLFSTDIPSKSATNVRIRYITSSFCRNLRRDISDPELSIKTFFVTCQPFAALGLERGNEEVQHVAGNLC